MIQIPLNKELLTKHVEIISGKILSEIENQEKSITDRDTLKCLEYLQKDDKIIEILKSNVSELRNIIDDFEKKYPNSIGKDEYKNKDFPKSDIPKIYRTLKDEIFEKEYKNWGSRTTYGAYQFVKNIGLKTCPYCNRNYTFVVDQNDGKLRPEIDHFFPKSKYPFLAISFYNLIPSCPVCNHTKSDIVYSDLLNPYEIKKDDFKLTYTPQNADFINIEKEKYNLDSFEVDFIKGNEENLKIFKLKELYKQHKDIIIELILKKKYYPKSYIKELKTFGFSEDEIYRYIFSNYKDEKDLSNRPLSKLTRDIAEELGII